MVHEWNVKSIAINSTIANFMNETLTYFKDVPKKLISLIKLYIFLYMYFFYFACFLD